MRYDFGGIKGAESRLVLCERRALNAADEDVAFDGNAVASIAAGACEARRDDYESYTAR
jgi:hypothetical protein